MNVKYSTMKQLIEDRRYLRAYKKWYFQALSIINKITKPTKIIQQHKIINTSNTNELIIANKVILPSISYNQFVSQIILDSEDCKYIITGWDARILVNLTKDEIINSNDDIQVEIKHKKKVSKWVSF